MTYFNAVAKGSDIDFMMEYYDAWGEPTTYPHMAAGWAVCFDSPFTWTKQVASNYGGTRNAMVIHYPDRIKGKGELRSQWHHVIDVTDIKADTKLPKGKSTVKMDFAYDGGDKPGAGGTATLYIDGKAVGSGKIAATEFSIFSADEGAGVGNDMETAVSDSYDRSTSEFTGKIDTVTITLK